MIVIGKKQLSVVRLQFEHIDHNNLPCSLSYAQETEKKTLPLKEYNVSFYVDEMQKWVKYTYL